MYLGAPFCVHNRMTAMCLLTQLYSKYTTAAEEILDLSHPHS